MIAEQRTSRKGRYHLRDAYFRFLAPHHDRLAFAPQEALQLIQANLRAFVGQTGFARRGVTAEARREAARHAAILVDAPQLDAELH